MKFENTLEFARSLDKADPLKNFRQKFHIPPFNGTDCIYFTGNSLGLQPKTIAAGLQQELDDWARLGVEGHFHALRPWVSYHEVFPALLASITGSEPDEVVVMNQLTVNLHLLMVSFYRPSSRRYKIICEGGAFPSDQYALESQARLHGFDPASAIVEIFPRQGEYVLRTEDILSVIHEHGDSIALVLFGGINYYTGQLFDMRSITEATHQVGAIAGFDLAHAAGNVKLLLHEWNVDFACWCSYKYLNSGPGAVAGIFIHQRHIKEPDMPRLAGWWGHNKNRRFKMEKGFDPIPTAEGWQLSNAPVLSMAAHKASLDIFEEAGMERLIAKSKLLSGYLLFVLNEINSASDRKPVEIITPLHENERGCQVSMLMKENGRAIFKILSSEGVVTDWRDPDVIRVAPVPLYNTFEEVWKFGGLLSNAISEVN